MALTKNRTVLTRSPAITRSARRGSVSIELALVVSLFLFPLTAGCLDSLYLLVVRYQANQVIQSIYLFAWANPTQSNNSISISNVINLDNKSALEPFSLAEAPATTTTCLQSDGSSTPATNGTCASGTPQTNVSYNVIATIKMPVPLPVFGNNYPYQITGTITIQ